MADSIIPTIIPKGDYRVRLYGARDDLCQLEILDNPAKKRRIWVPTRLLLPREFCVRVDIVEDFDEGTIYNRAHRVTEEKDV